MWQVQAKPGNNGNLQEEESKGILALSKFLMASQG